MVERSRLRRLLRKRVRLARKTPSTLSDRRAQVERFFDRAWRITYRAVPKHASRESIEAGKDLAYLEQFVKNLDAVSRPEGNERWISIIEMGRHGQAPEKFIPYLAYAALRDPNPRYRDRALMRLRQIRSPIIRDVYRYAVIHDKELANRGHAAELLGHFPGPESTATLWRFLRTEKDSFRRRAGIESLGKVGDLRTGRGLLRVMLHETDQFNRDALYEAIFRIVGRENREINEAILRYPLGLSLEKKAAVGMYAAMRPDWKGIDAFNLADKLFDMERRFKRISFKDILSKLRIGRDLPVI